MSGPRGEALVAPAATPGAGAAPGFSFWVGVAFSVNFIMGTGFLGIPSAFVKSGLLLGPLLILVGCVFMNASKDYVLEAMARAEAIAKAREIAERAIRDAKAGGPTIIVPTEADYLISSVRKFEITDLFVLFMGPRARTLYAVILSMYMYGGLTSYTSVWSNSFSANVPIVFLNGGATCNTENSFSECRGPYTVWLAIFASMAIPLACVDLHEQVFVQVTMFIARIVVVLLLTGTVLGGLGCNGVVFAETAPGGLPPFTLANLSGLSVIIPVAIYAFIFHHSIPGLSQPVADKKSLSRMFLVAFLIITAAYASVGFLVALYFGEDVNSQCSLNWRQYVGCMPKPPGYTVADAISQHDAFSASASGAPGDDSSSSSSSDYSRNTTPALLWSAGLALTRLRGAWAQQHSSSDVGGGGGIYASLSAAPCTDRSTWSPEGTCIDWEARPLYATIISFIVLIFPALDVLSAFPLNAITLGNNLMSAFLGEAALTPPEAEDEEDAAAAGKGNGSSHHHHLHVDGGAEGETSSLLQRASSSAALLDASSVLPAAPSTSSPKGIQLTTPRVDSGLHKRGGSTLVRAAAVAAAGGGGAPVSPIDATMDDDDADDDGASGDDAAANRKAARRRHRREALLLRPWYLRTRRLHRLTKIGFRLLAAVPPVIVAAFVSDLGVILQFTGIVGVAIAFIVPALLRIYSMARMRAVFALLSRMLLSPSAATAAVTASEPPLPESIAAKRPSLPSVEAALTRAAIAIADDSESGVAAAPTSTGGRARSSSVIASRALIDRACAASKEMDIPLSELVERTGMEGALITPYTSWATGWRGAEVMFVCSIVMGVYVFVQTLINVMPT